MRTEKARAAMPPCSVADCSALSIARGWCGKHLARFYRWDDIYKKAKTGPKQKAIEKKFWPHVKTGDGCWIWTGALDSYGYGLISVPASGRTRHHLKAHRVSFEIHYGHIPTGLSVLHHCDVPSCVRPDHLFAGTQAENMNDMKLKGRASNRILSNRARRILADVPVRARSAEEPPQ